MSDSDKTGKFKVITRCKAVDPAVKCAEMLENAVSYAQQFDATLAKELEAMMNRPMRFIGEL